MSISPDGQGFCQSKNHVAPAVDSLREEFRKYLENSGLPVVLTRVIKDIYEKDPKPADPLGFLVNILGAVNFYSRETTALKDELLDLKALVKSLEEENKLLREKLEENIELE